MKEKQQEIGTGNLSDKNIYAAKEVGWTLKVPDGWDVMTHTEKDKMNEKGKGLIEKTVGSEVDVSALKELINLKKDAFNSFLSTIEPYEEKEAGSYAGNNQKLYDIIKETYASQGIHAEYEEGTATIDDLSFYTFTTIVYSPDKSKVILSQKMYSRLINGYDFGMTITYNNKADQKTLERMMASSSFSKKD